MKIIIHINDKVRPEVALEKVRDVILGGRVSNDNAGKQYCWVTTFGSNGHKKTVVYSKGHRKGSETESFYVSKR